SSLSIRGLFRVLLEESRLFAQRQSTGLAGVPRIELPLQQFDFVGGLLCGPVGNALPRAFRMGCGKQNRRGASFLQQSEYSHRAVSFIADRRWALAGVAKDFF